MSSTSWRPELRHVAAALALSLASAAGAQVAPMATHPYRPGIDILDYDLSLALPDSGPVIAGRALLTLRRTPDTDTLALDLLDLRVDSVLVGGASAAYRHEHGVLRIALPRGGDSLQVAVVYGGAVRDGLIVRTDSLGRWTGFGDNWPNRARHWIPSVDHPSDKATVTWRVTAPEGRTVVANGRLHEETPLAPDELGRRRVLTVWRESQPIPPYLMVVGAGPLAYLDLGLTACGVTERPACVPQSVYVAPELRDYLPGPFGEADSIVAFFSSIAGPFPYEKLAHLQSATRFGGMENATAIFYSDGAFRRRAVGIPLIAHETAHQWFGDAVTEREWAHLWLSEGFATYFAALYTEASRGDSAFRATMRTIRDEITSDSIVATRPVIDTAETDYLKLLNANSYQKGGFTLHMLRTLIGDSAFRAGIRRYVDAHRHGTALTADLRQAMEAVSGQQLGWFFDQWLRRPGWAQLRTSWRYDPSARRVILQVTQGGRWPPYRFPLTVGLRDAAGAMRRVTVPVDAVPTQRIVLPVTFEEAPAALVVDPDVQLLATFTSS